MACKYEIRQLVETIDKKWLVPLWESQIERVAINEFDKIVKEYPGKYFELVFMDVTEDCIKFTKIPE